MKTSDKWLSDPHMAEVKLVYQSNGSNANRPILSSPEDVFRYLLTIWDIDRIEMQEEFCILLFNNAMRCLGWHRLSTGGICSTVVEISQLLAVAALGNANSVIVAHNHPSGMLKASTADIQLTKRIYIALKHVGIRLNDHLIITRDDYFSFSQRGLLHKIDES